MILELMGIKGGDKQDTEHLLMKVIKNGNLSGYAVIDNTFNSDGSLSNVHRHFYAFPSCEVKEGDFVRLYTTTGTYSPKDNKANTKTHHFYWNLNVYVWNTDDTAVLLKVIDSTKKKL